MSEKMNVEKGPIRVFQSDEKVVDLSWIISQTDDEILKIFPEGVYQGVVLFTNCADMQNGTGRIAIDYLGTKKGWLGFGSKVYQVIAEIDTQNETLEISSSDVTDDYPIFVNHPKPTKEEFLKVMTIAHNYIKSSKIESCQVIVTQLENRWDVMCDPASSTELKCDFRIDAKSFDVINQKPPQ